MDERCDIIINKRLDRRETDSMVNNEETRFERSINKVMTVPSRMKGFLENFNRKEKSEADHLVQGLTARRRGTKFKSVQESANSRLITSKKLNLVDPEKYFSKIENVRIYKSAGEVSYIKLESIKNDNLHCPDIVKDVFEFHDNLSYNGSGFSSNKSLIKADKDGSGNVPFVGDLMKDNDYDYNFLIDTSTPCDGNLKDLNSEVVDCAFNNVITVTFSPPVAGQAADSQNYEERNSAMIFDEESRGKQFILNENSFLRMVSSEEESDAFIINFRLMIPNSDCQDVFNLIKQHFITLLTTTASTQFLIKFFSNLPAKLIVQLISDLDLVSACMQPNYQCLIELLQSLPTSNLELIEHILIKFDSVLIWKQLIVNKYGKNVVEFLIDNLLSFSVYKRKKLYELIESSLVEFSKKNYATFVVQFYLNKEKSRSALKSIIENLINITSCRNGVFVVISATKVFNGQDLTELLDKIIQVSDTLSKNAYASTLMEYVFINHTQYAAPNFIKIKSNCFLDIIEDNCGNYIIQKLLNVVSPELRKEMSEILIPLIDQIRKQNIKKKWNQILNNQDNVSINNSVKSSNISCNSRVSNANSSSYRSVNSKIGSSSHLNYSNSNYKPTGLTSKKFLAPANTNTQPIIASPYQLPQYSLNMSIPTYGGFHPYSQVGYSPFIQSESYNKRGTHNYNMPTYLAQPSLQPSNNFYYNFTGPQINQKSFNPNTK